MAKNINYDVTAVRPVRRLTKRSHWRRIRSAAFSSALSYVGDGSFGDILAFIVAHGGRRRIIIIRRIRRPMMAWRRRRRRN